MTGQIITTITELAKPDHAETISYIMGQATQFLVLSPLIVGIVNQIKNTIPSIWRQYMWVVAILLGVGLLSLINGAFSIGFNIFEIIFYGLIVGAGSVGIYEGGFGNKNTTDTIISSERPIVDTNNIG